MKQKWKWGVAFAVFAGAMALAADLLEIAEWMKEARNENQDKRIAEVKEEPVDEITIVLTELENDTEGFGVSIKRTIKDAGWEYRRLKRTVKDVERIERSREEDQEAAKLDEQTRAFGEQSVTVKEQSVTIQEQTAMFEQQSVTVEKQSKMIEQLRKENRVRIS